MTTRGKIILTLLILGVTAFAGRAGETNGLTIKVTECDRDKDGKPDFRSESTFRDSKRVMMVWNRLNTQGVWAVTLRSYHVSGDMVAVETDDDHDGFLETLVVYRSGTEDMEVYSRKPDGAVMPVSAATLQAFKKQNAAVSEFTNKFFDKDADFQKVEAAMMETQKKLRAAEKEKTP